MSDDSIIGSIVSDLNKRIGSGTACVLSKGNREQFKCISTGCTLLDIIVSNRYPEGGIPLGKVTTIAGDYSSGKSLLCYHLIANVQRVGGIAVLLDTERSIEEGFIKRVGVDIDNLVYVEPGTCESAFEAIDGVIDKILVSKNDKPVIVCWDSIAATPTKAEVEGEDFDPTSTIAVKARTISKSLSMLTGKIDQSNIALVLTNQLRTKIGVSPFVDPDIMPGGRAIGFYSTVIIKLFRGKKLEDDAKNVIGMRCFAKTEKSRMSPPFRRCDYKMFFDRGIDDWGSVLDYLINAGVIEKRHGIRAIKLESGEEITFRENEWAEKARDESFKSGIYNKLKELMVINYDRTISECDGIEVED